MLLALLLLCWALGATGIPSPARGCHLLVNMLTSQLNKPNQRLCRGRLLQLRPGSTRGHLPSMHRPPQCPLQKLLESPRSPSSANNFAYYSVCTYSYGDYLASGSWSDIITVEVCEDFWHVFISDDPLAKYNGSTVLGNSTCRVVTDSACGVDRVIASSIPGS